MNEKMRPLRITDDARPILAIWNAIDPVNGAYYRVGSNGVTRIVAYGEAGQMSLVAWLAVYRGEEIAYRFPAAPMAIKYMPVDDDMPMSGGADAGATG